MSSDDALYIHEVSWEYLERFSSYRVDRTAWWTDRRMDREGQTTQAKTICLHPCRGRHYDKQFRSRSLGFFRRLQRLGISGFRRTRVKRKNWLLNRINSFFFLLRVAPKEKQGMHFNISAISFKILPIPLILSCWVDSSIFLNWKSQFFMLGVSGVFYFYQVYRNYYIF